MQERRGVLARASRRISRTLGSRPTLTAAVVAMLLTVWVFWSLLVDLRNTTSSDPDVGLFVWSMEHAPWRVLHGRNPFFSTSIFATTGGANLAFSTTAPALAFMMYPVTAILGPIAGINVLTALTPVLNTLAARRLLRIASGSNGWSVTLGAVLVGFSPLVLMHDGGRFQIAFQAVALLLLAELWRLGAAWFDGDPLSWQRFAAAGALAGLQTWIGSEQLAVVSLIALISFVTAVVSRAVQRSLHPVRPRRSDVVASLVGIATMVVVASPFLAAFLFGSERYTDPYHAPARHLFGIRLANALTPTEAVAIDSHVPLSVARHTLSVFPEEDTGYISIAGLAFFVLVAITWRRRTRLQRGALVVGLVCWLLAAGPTMRWTGVGGGMPGPWRVFEHIPLVDEIIANRISLGVYLALGVIVATLGATSRSGLRSFGGVAICAFVLIPILMFPAQFSRTHVVSSAADELLTQQCADALVVTVPQDLEQEAMAWQARSDMAFDLYRGFAFRASTLPKGDPIGLDRIALNGLSGIDPDSDPVDELALKGIGCVVTPASQIAVIDNVSTVLGSPLIAGDVAVWTLS